MTEKADAEANALRKKRNFRGVSPEQRQAERRSRLIEAGLRLYGQHGFHAVTVREVCAEAQLTERYFYESFQGSEALFAAVYEHLVTQVENAILGALIGAGDQPLHLARQGLTAFLRHIEAHPPVARILFVEVPRVRFDPSSALLQRTIGRFDQLIALLMTMVFPEYRSSGLNLELLAAGLNGSNIHIASRWVMGGFREPFEEVLENSYAVFAAMVEYVRRLAAAHQTADGTLS